jgi:deoxyribonuclease-4
MPVAAHSSYLINCASPDREIRAKSWQALADELGRCERLGIPALIFHPGSHDREDEGVRLVGEAMTRALAEVPGKVRLLVETTAGQGSSLGWRFEQLQAIREQVPGAARRRVGVCVDTCHVHSAGYDLETQEGYEETFARLDRSVGLANVRAFHLNDSKKPRGCRVDRHEHIGDGTLGKEPFRRLVNDARFAEIPAFVETESRWKENIEVLRGLVRR